MHILHLTPYYTPAYAFGGVVRSVEGMTQVLHQRGHRITVLTTDALDQTSRYANHAEEIINGIQVYRSPNVSPQLRGKVNLSTPNKMQALAQQILDDVDVLHCHEFRTIENLVVTPIAQQMKIPMILSPHGTLIHSTGRSRLKKAWDTLLSPALARRFDHVIALTHQELVDAQALWTQFGKRKIPAEFHIIPNAIDPTIYQRLPNADEFRQRYGIGDATVVLFMGRLQARKGVDLLAQAFIKADMPNTRLLIVGPDEGMQPTLESYHDERIILTGYLEGNERLQAYAVTDVFALPAIGEGLSMAVLEALASGIPVLISPGCNLPEVAEYEAGLIVDVEVDAIEQALKTLLSSSTKLHDIGLNGQDLVQEKFTWEQIAEQFETVYQQAISSAS